MSKINKLEKLFDDIKIPVGGETPISDGIVNFDKYSNAKYKVLWVLNDANDLIEEKNITKGFDMREALFNLKAISMKGVWRRIFTPISFTTYGILNDFQPWGNMGNILVNLDIAESLKEMAFINLMKIPSSDPNSKSNKEVYYEQEIDFVLKQIDAFNPDIIIGAKTIEILAKDLGITLIDKQPIMYAIKNNQLFIDAHHPDKRIENLTQEEYCDSIINCVKEWKAK